MTTPNAFQDMHNFHPNYMIGPPQVSDEFNLLNDFLHSSMLEDGGLASDEQLLGNQPDTVPKFLSTYSTSNNNSLDQAGNEHLLPASAMQSGSMLPPPLNNNSAVTNADQARAISRSSSVVPIDKARDYWLQAADPAGNDTPDQRMQKLLKAKYDAGLLRPFNYVKGYARLSKYLEGHVAPASRQKISRQLDRFRPLFREKMHALTDMDLIVVEMWFEETLMGYDRVFASMAVPACCWRRTGEIFRGNKEMAELINVPVEMLRDVSHCHHNMNAKLPMDKGSRLTTTAGQDRSPRDSHGRFGGQILGRVWHNCLRPSSRYVTDSMLPQISRRNVKQASRELLFLVYDTEGRAQDVRLPPCAKHVAC